MTPSAKRSLSAFNPHIDPSRKRFCPPSTAEEAEACGEVLLYFDEEGRKHWGTWLQWGLDSAGVGWHTANKLTGGTLGPGTKLRGATWQRLSHGHGHAAFGREQRFRPRGSDPTAAFSHHTRGLCLPGKVAE